MWNMYNYSSELYDSMLGIQIVGTFLDCASIAHTECG